MKLAKVILGLLIFAAEAKGEWSDFDNGDFTHQGNEMAYESENGEDQEESYESSDFEDSLSSNADNFFHQPTSCLASEKSLEARLGQCHLPACAIDENATTKSCTMHYQQRDGAGEIFRMTRQGIACVQELLEYEACVCGYNIVRPIDCTGEDYNNDENGGGNDEEDGDDGEDEASCDLRCELPLSPEIACRGFGCRPIHETNGCFARSEMVDFAASFDLPLDNIKCYKPSLPTCQNSGNYICQLSYSTSRDLITPGAILQETFYNLGSECDAHSFLDQLLFKSGWVELSRECKPFEEVVVIDPINPDRDDSSEMAEESEDNTGPSFDEAYLNDEMSYEYGY